MTKADKPKTLKQLSWTKLYDLKRRAEGLEIDWDAVPNGPRPPWNELPRFPADPELFQAVNEQIERRSQIYDQLAEKRLEAATSLLPWIKVGDHSDLPLRQGQVLDVLYANGGMMTEYKLWKTLEQTVWPKAAHQNVQSVVRALARKKLVQTALGYGPKRARAVIHPIMFSFYQFPDSHYEQQL